MRESFISNPLSFASLSSSPKGGALFLFICPFQSKYTCVSPVIERGNVLMTSYDHVTACCDRCGGEIYLGEEYHRINGENVCDDCFEDFARQLLRPFLVGGEG